MTDTYDEFEQAQKDVDTLNQRPSKDDLLALYAHYKQATHGDVSGKRPSTANLKKRAKYDAWANLKSVQAEAAMIAYTKKVQQLLAADH